VHKQKKKHTQEIGIFFSFIFLWSVKTTSGGTQELLTSCWQRLEN